MPVKNFLKPETKEKLQRALKEHEHPQIRERILIFLLLNTGNTQTQVAEIVGCSVRTVAYWSVHGEPENLESLKDERMKGNHQKATPDYINKLLQIIEQEPEEYGSEFGRWTTAFIGKTSGRGNGNRTEWNAGQENIKSKKVCLPLG